MVTIEIIWTSDLDRNLLCDAGLFDIHKFWEVETASKHVEYKHLRDEKTGKPPGERQTTCIRAKGARYYIKKASGHFYPALVNEFNALNTMSSIGVLTPILAAYFLDENSKTALLVYKNLAGFNNLRKLFEGAVSPDAIADFQIRKKQIIRELAETRDKIIKAGYLYSEWSADHIFVKYKGPGIVLTDFEQIEAVASMSWTRKNPISFSLIKMQEWKNFKSALMSKVYTDAFLKGILKEK